MARHFAADSAAGGSSRRRGGAFSLVMGLVLLLAGACLLLGPSVATVLEQGQVEQTVEGYRRGAGTSDTAAGESGAQEFRSKDDDPVYQALVDYNQKVREGTGDEVNDPFATEGGGISQLGVPDGLIGTLEVPSMGVTLPLYLGSTAENLSRGATVVAGTSMPIGGESTNCAIAAHRGGIWSGYQMFRDIENMQVGDTVTITTAWDRLTYRVVGTKIVAPSEVDSLAIQEGRDMVTLLTCHPYLVSTERYLVYCERVENDDAQASPGLVERVVRAYLPAPADDSPALTAEFALRVAGLVLLLVVAVALVVRGVRRVRGRG